MPVAMNALRLQPTQDQSFANFQSAALNSENAQTAQLNRAKAGMEMIASAAFGVMNGDLNGTPDPQKWDQALQFFKARGVPIDGLEGHPELAPIIAKSSAQVLQQAQDAKSFELGLQKFQFDVEQAKQNIAKGPKASLVPIWGTDAKGNYVLIQPTESGQAIQAQMPSGVTPVAPVNQMNTGTSFVGVDKYGRPTGGSIPINNEQKAYDTTMGGENAKLDAARPAMRSKAQSALSQLEGKQQFISDTIDTAISDMSGGWLPATGLIGDLTKSVPGTAAYQLYQDLLTIQANIGFDQLQTMRDNSPTGGALGQVSDTENKLLQAVQGSLAQGQSAPRLKKNLERIRELYAQMISEKRAAFQRDYGGGPAVPDAMPASGNASQPSATAPGAEPAPPPAAAPADNGGVVDWTDYFN